MSQRIPWAEQLFFDKIQNGRQIVEVVIPELFDIYFNVKPYFHMIFNPDFISEAISNF